MRNHLLSLCLWACACTQLPTLPDAGFVLTAAEIRVEVDPELKAQVDLLPRWSNGVARRPAAYRAADGTHVDFVLNEMIVVTQDDAQAQAMANLLGGSEVARVEWPWAGIPTWHILQWDASTEDPSRLAGDLSAWNTASGQMIHGTDHVSSPDALQTLAGITRISLDHAAVAMPNVILLNASLLDRTTQESPVATAAFAPDACQWAHMSATAPQKFAVCDAWRTLAAAGRLLPNSINVGVLDDGFAFSQELSSDPYFYVAATSSRMPPVPPVPGAVPCQASTPGGMPTPCPWHGTNVSHAAAGVPDNRFGAAGPGGPVARVVHISKEAPDVGGIMVALVNTLGGLRAGLKILNMSFGGDIPASLVPLTGPSVDVAFGLMRAGGVLLLAAAGNQGLDVDARDCLADICWERSLTVPCEARGVACVGGLDFNSRARAPLSNFGSRMGDEGSVDFMGPWTVAVGADPGNAPTTDLIQAVSGTSMASPFLAGVAALIWAAGPEQSADDVEARMRAFTTRELAQYATVNAAAAVLDVLGGEPNHPPSVSFVSPADGATLSVGQPATFLVSATDAEDSTPTLLEWFEDGMPVETNVVSIARTFTAAGTHSYRVRAVDGAGLQREAYLSIAVNNVPPVAVILDPGADAVGPGQPTRVAGLGRDPNLTGFVPCNQLTWSTSDAAATFPSGNTGCVISVVWNTLGMHTLTLQVTDGELTASRQQMVRVGARSGLPPTITLQEPEFAATFTRGSALRLRASVVDPEAEPGMELDWFINSYTADDQAAGTWEMNPPRGLDVLYAPELVGNGGILDLAACQRNAGQFVKVTLRARDAPGNYTYASSAIRLICPPQ